MAKQAMFQVPEVQPDGSHVLRVPDPKAAAYRYAARLILSDLGPYTMSISEGGDRFTVSAAGIVTTIYVQE